MNEKKELKWLREDYISQRRRRTGFMRGWTLYLITCLPLSYILDLNVGDIILLALVLFGLGFFSSYFGRFKYKYALGE